MRTAAVASALVLGFEGLRGRGVEGLRGLGFRVEGLGFR